MKLNDLNNPMDGPQYLEDLATGYWFSEVLFTAVELQFFTLIEDSEKSLKEIAEVLDLEPKATLRFLKALCALGLLVQNEERFLNTQLASQYLVLGKKDYQGDSILWRKQLIPAWQDLGACLQAGKRVHHAPPQEDSTQQALRIRRYISAMDNIARAKAREITMLFQSWDFRGQILDVGAGSGAIATGFLTAFPETTAVLLDLPEILHVTKEMMAERMSDGEHLDKRISFYPLNILETWPDKLAGFELIVLSNIVHAYDEQEIFNLLKKASVCLSPNGVLLIHDFFPEHYSEKAALFDLNMLINTYNGKIFPQDWLQAQLTALQLHTTGLIPLRSDTALLIACRKQEILTRLAIGSE